MSNSSHATVIISIISYCIFPIAVAQTPPAEPAKNLYAIEIKTGSAWDTTKPPQEQAYMREHSANLKRLRDQGSLVMGARYSDKGLVVLQATNAEEAHAMMAPDISIQNKTFAYELHDFNVFYSGTLQSKRRVPPVGAGNTPSTATGN